MKEISSENINDGLALWKFPLVFSLMIHLFLALFIFLFPAHKKEAPPPFVTRLVTPEELAREFPAEKPAGMPRSKGLKHIERPRVLKPLPHTKVRPSSPQIARTIPPLSDSGIKTPEKEMVPDNVNKGLAAQNPPTIGKLPGAELKKDSGKGELSKGPIIPAPSLKEKLFDREIIAKSAQKEEKKHDNSITFDTHELKYESYMLKLKDRIESIWHYPRDAAARGIFGDLYIEFTIKKNGRLEDVKLARTSGNRSLDEAAMRALRDGEPFWPLPDEWGTDSFTVTGHFIYSLYGTYIR